MYLNQFSVRIPQGTESSGYVELVHNTQYTLILRNSRAVRCDARVEIDGKHVGTWRIGANSNVKLERPVHDTARFTFYKLGSKKGRKAELDSGNPNLGLVKVTFTPEKSIAWSDTCDAWAIENVKPWATYNSAMQPKGLTECNTRGMSAGGTGLSGKSHQTFYNVSELDYDHSQQTVIHLRLVAKNGKEPRPLTAYSTPVPPVVS